MSTLAVELLAPGRLWWLVAVAALAGVYVAAQFARRRHVVEFTNVDLLDAIAPKRPGWRRHVVAGLSLVAAVLGVVALARPIERRVVASPSGGRIVLVFDISLSMQATDIEPDRLTAAKDAAIDFVRQVDDGIQVGLVSFSADVHVRESPTLDHQAVEDAIESLQLEAGTAIGDALATAAEIIGPPESSDGKPAGAIVLLSDGETTAGRSTAQGAQDAADLKVPVYSIAFGTDHGIVTIPQTGERVPVPVGIDELAETATITGGTAYEAPSADALAEAYDAISTTINQGAGEPIEMITEQTWKLVAVMLSVLTVAWLLAMWWLRGLL
jgi:Ca-activated chloride channel family protein